MLAKMFFQYSYHETGGFWMTKKLQKKSLTLLTDIATLLRSSLDLAEDSPLSLAIPQLRRRGTVIYVTAV